MVFQWFFLPGPSPLNVLLEMDHWYQWFSNGFLEFWCNGQRWFWPRKNLKLRENCDISYFATTVRIILELENIKCFISQFLTMYPCQFQSYRVFFSTGTPVKSFFLDLKLFVLCFLFFEHTLLLPSLNCNGFQRYHHHWMEWLGATIGINGFPMVLG